jgi:phage terminase large subunit-like protein
MKVTYKYNNNGWPHDAKIADEYLELDKEYEVHHIVVHAWHTEVFLKDFPDVGFNGVLFEGMPSDKVIIKIYDKEGGVRYY